MSPGALALAVLLHVAAALAMWWMTVNRPTVPPVEEAIEITIEKPKPPDPPPPPEPTPPPQQPPPPKPKPQPAPPLVVDGLRPFAETAEKRSQVRPSGDAPKDITGAPPRSLEDEVPKPTSPPPPTETAMRQEPAPPAPTQTPPTPQQQALPKPEAGATVAPVPTRPTPPATTPAPTVAQPQSHPMPPPSITPQPQPQPRPPPSPPLITPHPQPRPTPQIGRPQERPPAIARRGEPPSNSPLVNPADVRNRNLASDNYLIQFNRKLRTYRFDSGGIEAHAQVRVVIARDGQLLEAALVRSSGYDFIDRGMLTALRNSSPYPPLPPEMGVDSATFILPVGTGLRF
ncbi:hypothetical protein BH10PSE6_BH10PSE6_15020 [soil metagenome]